MTNHATLTSAMTS